MTNVTTTTYTKQRFEYEMDTVTLAKERAVAAQKKRQAKRVSELRGVTEGERGPIVKDRHTARTAEVVQGYYLGQPVDDAIRHVKGHRTYYTFKGKPAAVKEAARLTLAPYTWAGPNPYAPRTDEVLELGGGRIAMVVSRCTNS